MTMQVVPATDISISALRIAVSDWVRHSAWRRHRLFTPDELRQLEWSEVENTLHQQHAVIRFLADKTRVAGYCAITPLTWDSAHFGLPMAKLDMHISTGTDPELIDTLLTATLAAANSLHARHVSTHVDLDNYPVFNALAARGFHLCDIKRRYVIRKLPAARMRPKIFSTRPLKNDDHAAVLQLISDAPFHSRFTRDPALNGERSAAMYRIWAERLLDCPASDSEKIVVERRGERVAFGGLLTADFSSRGVPRKILADAIFACSTSGIGSFVPVVRTLAENGLARFPLVEARISANNAAAARVLEDGGYHSTTSDYALHLHL